MTKKTARNKHSIAMVEAKLAGLPHPYCMGDDCGDPDNYKETWCKRRCPVGHHYICSLPPGHKTEYHCACNRTTHSLIVWEDDGTILFYQANS